VDTRRGTPACESGGVELGHRFAAADGGVAEAAPNAQTPFTGPCGGVLGSNHLGSIICSYEFVNCENDIFR
jgi:hypothetical protein